MSKRIDDVLEEMRLADVAKGLSEHTLFSYHYQYKYLKKYFSAHKITRVRQLLAEHFVEEFTLACVGTGIVNETTNTYLKALRRIYRFAYEHSYLSKLVHVPLMSEADKTKPTLSLNDVDKIFADTGVSTPRVLAIFILGTGLRSRTVRNIKVEDIDFTAKLVTCRKTKNHRLLILPLIEGLCRLLQVYISAHGLKPDDWLFLNSRGGQFRKSSLYATLNKYYEKLGIDKTGVHLIRHTFGKCMVLNHCDEFTLMRWFGHRKTEETKKYVSLFASDLERSIDQFNPLHGREFV